MNFVGKNRMKNLARRQQNILSDPADFLDLYLQKVTKLQRFDKLLEAVKPVSGTAGNLVFEMEVKPHHTNNFGILHGGMSAYLIDTLTTVSQVTLGIPPGMVGCFGNLFCLIWIMITGNISENLGLTQSDLVDYSQLVGKILI